MYKIKIKKGWWPWKRQQLAVKALDFAIKHYELQNECVDYPVKLILTKFKDNYYGDSWMHEWGYEIRINSRFNDYRMIRTIFHEMTHVKQFALGELELGTKAVSYTHLTLPTKA